MHSRYITRARYTVTVWHGEHTSIARVIDQHDDDADVLGYYNARDGAGWLEEALAHAARLNAAETEAADGPDDSDKEQLGRWA